jgi:hypothetical protein
MNQQSFGDVYDTPPRWIRVMMGLACLVGGAFMLIYLFPAGFVVPAIIVIASLILAIDLIIVVPTGRHVALVTVLFWALLGGLALYLPL